MLYDDSEKPRRPLSAREIEILNLIAKGYKYRRIGKELGISHQTVKNHLSNIYSALGVVNAAQAVYQYFVEEKRAEE